MKNIFTIKKKEFTRFFTDRRMIMNIILPGVLIYILYSLIGGMVADMTRTDANYKPTAYTVNMPEALAPSFDAVFDITDEQLGTDEAKALVSSGDLDIAVVFPENFGDILADSELITPAPDVAVWFNSSETNSTAAYGIALSLLESVNTAKFTVNTGGAGDLAGARDTAGTILAAIVPMILMSLLASSCVAVAPESIAGEKERGTMATMLISPVKRWQIAMGKI